MKTLSIIGIVISCFGILVGIIASSQSDYNPGLSKAGGLMLIGSLYFLAFSIVSSVISFRKKKVDAAQN
jgi:hypothetical protein